MSAPQRAIQEAIVVSLRASSAIPSKSALRELVADELGEPVGMPELAAAIQALRYQGKLAWDRLELSASMQEPSAAGNSAAAEEEGGAAEVRAAVEVPPSKPSAAGQCPEADRPPDGPTRPLAPTAAGGPDDDDDYPGEVNDAHPDDCRGQSEDEHAAGSHGPAPSPVHSTLGRRAVHGANTRAATRPVPAPKHESEVERAAREDATAAGERRRLARSTATVRVPLELRRLMGGGEPTLAEAIQTALAAEPHDLIAAINRKHPLLWKRVIALGRATGKRPGAALYDALERGLAELEQGELSDAA